MTDRLSVLDSLFFVPVMVKVQFMPMLPHVSTRNMLLFPQATSQVAMRAWIFEGPV